MPSRPAAFSRYDLGMVVVSLIWGANFSAIKYALRSIPPLAFSASRFVLASLVLWVMVRVIEGPARLPRRGAGALLLLGVVGNTGYQAAFMVGLARTTATNSALILGAMPVMVALLATGFGVERLSGRLWVGMALAMAGVVFVMGARGAHLSHDTLAGDVLVLVACFCWAVFTVGLRKVARGMSPLRVTAVTTMAGTPGLLLAAWSELPTVRWSALDAGTWFGVVYSGLLAICLAYVLWTYAVKHIGGSRTAVYNCVVPVVAGLVAWVVLGERPTGSQIAGATLVIGGVLVSQTGPRAASDLVPAPDPVAPAE